MAQPTGLCQSSSTSARRQRRDEARRRRASSCFALAATHASISVCGHHLDPRAHPPLQSLPYLSASPSPMDSSEAVAAVSRSRSLRLPLTFLTGSLAPPRREAPRRQPPRAPEPRSIAIAVVPFTSGRRTFLVDSRQPRCPRARHLLQPNPCEPPDAFPLPLSISPSSHHASCRSRSPCRRPWCHRG